MCSATASSSFTTSPTSSTIPINGDQFEQFENRWTTGAKLTHRRIMRLGGKPTENAFGVDVRNDSVGGPLGLYLTRATERLSTVRADEADQVSVGMFGETEIEWSRTFRTTFGLRGDVYHWNVRSDNPLNSGKEPPRSSAPRCRRRSAPGAAPSSMRTGDWASIPTPAWASRCRSIRSPANRPTLAAVRARPGRRVRRPHRGPARAADDGDGVVSRLRFRADLRRRFRQHRGGPGEPPHGHRDHQLHLSQPWTTMDLDLSFSRARFLDVPAGEDFVPGALNRVISAGIAVNPPAGVSAGPFGSLRLRHFGPRPLIEDNSVKSKATSIVNGEVGYKFSERVRLTARRLQPLRRQGVRHRLLLRITPARRAGACRGHSLPCRDSALGASGPCTCRSSVRHDVSAFRRHDPFAPGCGRSGARWAFALTTGCAAAQDLFELEVFEYTSTPRRRLRGRVPHQRDVAGDHRRRLATRQSSPDSPVGRGHARLDGPIRDRRLRPDRAVRVDRQRPLRGWPSAEQGAARGAFRPPARVAVSAEYAFNPSSSIASCRRSRCARFSTTRRAGSRSWPNRAPAISIFGGVNLDVGSGWELSLGAGCLTNGEPWVMKSVIGYRF